MPYRSSFRSQYKNHASALLILLAVLPALAVGLVSYNFMHDYVREDRRGDVRQLAELTHDQMMAVLARANDHAISFLADLGAQCGDGARPRKPGCEAGLIRSYLAAEGALGATLRRRGSADLNVGASAIRRGGDWKFEPGQLAKLARVRKDNEYAYFVIASAPPAGLELAVTYPSSTLVRVFGRHAEFGDASGAVLADAEGNVVAEAMDSAGWEKGRPVAARYMQACLSGGSGEVADAEYRGRASVLGFHAVPEIGSGCAIAHVDRDEVFAPLATVEREALALLLVFLLPVALAARYFGRKIAKTDAALQGALSLKQSILGTSPAGFVAYRQDGQCVMVNPAASRMVGGTESEMLGHNFLTLTSWKTSGLLGCADNVLESGVDMEYETQLTTSFGRHLWLHCHLSRFLTRGEPHLMVMLLDIGEARRAEQALKESEEFNRRIIASSSDCIKVLDLNGNLISMSEGGQRLLEIADVGCYLGRSWVNFWKEDDRAGVTAALESARRGEQGRFAAYRQTEKGTPKWWDVVITPITGASGSIERLLAVSRDVTERKEEEEQFGMMTRTSLDGFWITDERGHLLEVNSAYCELSGYARTELLGMCISDIEAVETPEDTAHRIQELMASGSVRFETRHRCRDGRILDVEVSARHTPSFGGKIYCFLRNITARKYAEKLLQDQRHQLEKEVQRRTAELIEANRALEASFRDADDLYQNAPCGYHSLDSNGVIVRINNTELNMLGYAREEMIGRRMQDLLTPAASVRFNDEFPRMMEAGQISGVETEIRRKDGSILHALINASAIRDESGQFVMSRAAVYDVTGQRQAEQAKLRLNRALRLLSEGNAALIHAADEQGLLNSICRLVVETGGYLMAWVGFAENNAEKSIRPVAQYGDTSGYVESINISWDDTERGQGPTAKAIRLGVTQVNQNWEKNPALRRWLAAAKQRGYRSSIAFPIVCEGRTLGALNMYSGDPGAFVPEEVRLLEELANNLAFGIEALRVRAREAEANKELKVHRNNLEILVAQRTAELSAAKLEAEQANNAKSRFLAAASHDLRQPLTALKLYVGVLKSSLDAQNGELLMNMQECIGGLSSLLSKLLDLSKLDAGVVKPRLASFSLDELLNKVVASHAPDADAKHLNLRHRHCGLTARTDPVLFQRIVGNLVANAIRYTVHGGVLIGCRRRQGRVWVEIWDTGVGIPADKTGEIFEEFKQLGDGSRTYGSGLGLTIVARTAELLNLKMRVQSRPARGSMFAIELPLGRKTQATAQPVFKIPNRGLRIAVVDDNPIVLNALVCGLESAGHEVIAAASGGDLLSKLDSVAPEIAVCDHRLGAGETGFDVIESVRAAFGAGVPAVIITGDTDPQLMRSMTRKGIIILHKPVELADLEERIEEAVGRPAVSA